MEIRANVKREEGNVEERSRLALSVTDYIVEVVPIRQKSKDGTIMTIMVTQQRRDLLMNIPTLRKLDAMLLATLDNFKSPQEFSYVSREMLMSPRKGFNKR